MQDLKHRSLFRYLVLVALLSAAIGFGIQGEALAQANSPSNATPQTATPQTATPRDAEQPKPTPAPATPAQTTPGPKPAKPGTTPAPAPAPVTPGGQSPSAAPAQTTPGTSAKPPEAAPDSTTLAPTTKPGQTEIEPNAAPGIPDNATTENVMVPARPLVMMSGQSSYDDAFTSLKASLVAVKAAMDKAGLKPSGHPITIFSEPDDKGFKYQAGIPIAAKPDVVPDLGKGVTIGQSPAGTAIKFQHRGAYNDIDSTYDVITAYLDAKGMQVDNPYIEEYLTDLTDGTDPNLQVDIYVFVKK